MTCPATWSLAPTPTRTSPRPSLTMPLTASPRRREPEHRAGEELRLRRHRQSASKSDVGTYTYPLAAQRRPMRITSSTTWLSHSTAGIDRLPQGTCLSGTAYFGHGVVRQRPCESKKYNVFSRAD